MSRLCRPICRTRLVDTLLDLVLLKRGVFRHLLYNRGSEPRKAFNSGKPVAPMAQNKTKKALLDAREMRRWSLVFKLAVVLIFLDAYIRWCHLNPNPPSAGSPWTLDHFAHFSRVLLGCVKLCVSFQHRLLVFHLPCLLERLLSIQGFSAWIRHPPGVPAVPCAARHILFLSHKITSAMAVDDMETVDDTYSCSCNPTILSTIPFTADNTMDGEGLCRSRR